MLGITASTEVDRLARMLYSSHMSIHVDDIDDDNAGETCPTHGLPEVWTTDPYAEEILGVKDAWCWLCPRCYADRADDI